MNKFANETVVIATLSGIVTAIAWSLTTVVIAALSIWVYKEAFIEPDSFGNRRAEGTFFLLLVCGPVLVIGMARPLLNVLLYRGHALVFRGDNLVYMPPFPDLVRASTIVQVRWGPQVFSKDGPDSVEFEMIGGRKLTIAAFLFATPFAELTARLRALGVPVPEDPQLTPSSGPRSPSQPSG